VTWDGKTTKRPIITPGHSTIGLDQHHARGKKEGKRGARCRKPVFFFRFSSPERNMRNVMRNDNFFDSQFEPNQNIQFVK
jgi:hypothetical protein